ncbi:MAG: PaaI family thioesterase [Syntrophobacteraceae bacterium]|nr:PaaI family thioesterase [Desulfobacteraceae bacterium]
MLVDGGFIRLPNRENHNCFGCSPTNDAGLRLQFYTDGRTVVTKVNVPGHLCGWENLVHGGVISTILDEVMGWSMLHILKKFTLTKSITVEFLKPVYIETELRAEARILEVKNDREALAEGLLFNENGVLCARSSGSFALFTSKAIQRLGIMNADTIECMRRIIEG